ncbi:uncharacterized protein LOC142026232 isoform X2 [Buteo buteo]|uniref:uncharacterized protein LOC142026232 isoform X2 n=1 Tax=Buteo buteo TaxID=30397 RepID=UPI003EB997D0
MRSTSCTTASATLRNSRRWSGKAASAAVGSDPAPNKRHIRLSRPSVRRRRRGVGRGVGGVRRLPALPRAAPAPPARRCHGAPPPRFRRRPPYGSRAGPPRRRRRRRRGAAAAMAAAAARERRREQLRRWEAAAAAAPPAPPAPPAPRARAVRFERAAEFRAVCAGADLAEARAMVRAGGRALLGGANADGISALHQACIDENMEVVQFLVESGADVNQADNEGWTPLHVAASCGYRHIAQYLLEHGADVAAVTSDGELPLEVAEDEGLEALLRAEGWTWRRPSGRRRSGCCGIRDGGWMRERSGMPGTPPPAPAPSTWPPLRDTSRS